MKITDVGQAKAEIHITGTLGGTPVYMAPEVYSRVYGTKADIYSLGLIMWEMWFGQRAFKAVTPLKTLQYFFDWVDRRNRPVHMQGCKTPSPFWKQLMTQCWDGNPTKRPTAKECHERMVKSVSPENSV